MESQRAGIHARKNLQDDFFTESVVDQFPVRRSASGGSSAGSDRITSIAQLLQTVMNMVEHGHMSPEYALQAAQSKLGRPFR